MKKTIIISGGDKGGIDFAKKYKDWEYDDRFIIACDKGYMYALQENIIPDLIIGDFDSYKGKLPEDIMTLRLPVEKDDTDTMHAVREAVANGSGMVVICCAFGGRADHLLSNIQAARFAAEHGLKAVLAGDDTIIYIVHDGEIVLEKDPRYSLSVLSLSDESTVSVSGTHYEVRDAVIRADFPIGQSNEWKEDKACIKVTSGTVAVINSLLPLVQPL